MVSRAHMLEAVRVHVPDMYAWVLWCYENDSILAYGDYTIFSREGVQQGDPLGPLLFALVIHSILRKIKMEIPRLDVNLWYLDDGSIAGKSEDVFSALRILQTDGPERGLVINPTKCELICHSSSLAAANTFRQRIRSELSMYIPDSKCFFQGNYFLLGSPIGSPEFCAQYVEDSCLAPAMRSLHMVKKLKDPQVAFALLRRCAGFGQLVFAIRTVPPSAHLAAVCAKLDDDMLSTVLSFIGTVDPSCYPQIRRTTRTGGFGFRASQAHMEAAYVSSVLACSELDFWKPSRAEGFNASVFEIACKLKSSSTDVLGQAISQKALSEAIDAKTLATELSDASPWDTRRLLSQSAPHAADWLLVTPNMDMNQSFIPKEFVSLARWWLGQSVYDSESECPACGQISDREGYHALTCPCWGGRIHRHHALANECVRFLQSAHHNPSREKTLDGTTRPADVFLPHWHLGKPLALDFAVTHPQQPQSFTIAGELTTGSWAATYADTHKSQFHTPCEAAGVSFQPMVVETFGAWDPAARKTLEEMADKYAVHQSVPATLASTIIFQRLNVTLMRMNARMLLVRRPVGFDAESPLYLDWMAAKPSEEWTEAWTDVWEALPDTDEAEDQLRF